MPLFLFPILLLAALICWMLSQRVQTRLLGGLAVLVVGVAIGLLLMHPLGLPWPSTQGYRWLEVQGFSVTVRLSLDGLNLLLALLALGCGMLCFWSLAGALGPSVTGYGGLFGALLLLLVGVLLALLSEDLILLVFGWGLGILAGLLARRVAGIPNYYTATALDMSLLGGLVLLAAVLLLAFSTGGSVTAEAIATNPVHMLVFACWLAAVAMTVGLPPFGRPVALEGGPLQLYGVLLGAGLPLLAGYSLLRLRALTAVAPTGGWPSAYYYALAVLGIVGVFCCTAAALRSSHLGTILGWQLSAQFGLVLLVLGIPEPGAAVVALALLLNACLTTVVGGLALAALVRCTGSFDLRLQGRLAKPLSGPGAAYVVVAASSVGLPPFWGFWGRIWLLDMAGEAYQWLLLPVIGASLLLALSYLAPLMLFWRMGTVANMTQEADVSRWQQIDLPTVLGAAVLLTMGLLPREIWQMFLSPAAAELLPDTAADFQVLLPEQAVEVFLNILALLLLVLVSRRVRQASGRRKIFTGGEALDPDDGTPLQPAVTGHSLRALIALAAPLLVYRALGRSLQRLSSWLSWALQVVDGRYYLTGVFVAIIVLIIVMVA